MATKTTKVTAAQKITKKKGLNKQIYEKASELNKFPVQIHCSIAQINSRFLHSLREKVYPAKILFGKKSVLKKVFNVEFEQNSFLIFCEKPQKDKILDILKTEKVTAYRTLNSHGSISIDAGKMNFSSAFCKDLKKYNMDVEVINGDVMLKSDFKWEGKIDRTMLNLHKILKLETEICPLKIVGIVDKL